MHQSICHKLTDMIPNGIQALLICKLPNSLWSFHCWCCQSHLTHRLIAQNIVKLCCWHYVFSVMNNAIDLVSCSHKLYIEITFLSLQAAGAVKSQLLLGLNNKRFPPWHLAFWKFAKSWHLAQGRWHGYTVLCDGDVLSFQPTFPATAHENTTGTSVGVHHGVGNALAL